MGMTIRVYARRVTQRHTGWDAARFRSDIESTLHEFVATQANWIDDLGPDARSLVEHARSSVSGGKRVRAAFCGWGPQPVAPTDQPIDESALLRACASLELLHASALV